MVIRWIAEIRNTPGALSLDPVTMGWLIVTGGSVARLGLGFVASVIIARSLGPAAFGVYAVLATVASFTGAAIDLGLTNAAVRRLSAVWPRDLQRTSEIWSVFFWFRVLLVGVAVAIGLLFAGPLSALFLDVSGRDLYFGLAILGVGATALSGTVTSILQATSHFGRLSAVLLANSGLTAILAFGLALAGQLTITTALLVLGIGTSLVSLALAAYLLPGAWSLRLPDRENFRTGASDLARFGVWLWLGSIFAILALYLDVLIVNHWAAPATVGIYALAVNLVIKVEVINHSLYTVLLPTASSLQSRGEVREYIRRGLIRSALIALALLPILFLSPVLIEIFYGAAYLDAAGIFQALLAITVFNILLTPLLMLAFTYDRPRVIALTDGVRAATLLVVALVLVPDLDTTGAIIAKLAAAIAGGIVVFVFVIRTVLPARDIPVDADQTRNGHVE